MTPSQELILEDLRDIDPTGILGGYSIAFDLISKEYGWTDDQIMELPIRTLRQKIAAINRRLYMKRREEISLVSWQTRQLASFIAGGYWVEGHNKALDQAQILAFDHIEKAQLDEWQERAESEPKQFEAKRGSFERFMGSMGDNTRWAGR